MIYNLLMKRKKVLLVYPVLSVFVQTDYEILSARFEVKKYHFRSVKGALPVLLEFLKQLVFLILKIWRFDTVFIWFADQHSFLPVLLSKLARKKCFLVIGGYDVCRIPKLNYGVFCSKPRGFAAAWSMRNSTMNLPVSTHVARKTKAISHKNNYELVYNCVNMTPQKSFTEQNRTDILTVALIDSERTYYIKGIDLIVETARLLPQFPFVIVGFDSNKLKHFQDSFPPNVKIVTETLHEDLPEFYARAKIYCQLSRSESFGIALAEAILHGCIPLVTNEGGMPEVVGDKNCIVKKNPEEIASKILQVFSGDDKTGRFAAKRIRDIFSLENRSLTLIKLLSDN
jgi:glycosyltransferase involved in cell wall biosynthesis